MKCKRLLFDYLPKIILLLLSVCVSLNALGQKSYETSQIKKLAIKGYNVKLSPQGDKLLYTNANFKGLRLYDIESQKATVISDETGAGYNAQITNDLIHFKPKRTDTFMTVTFDNKTVKSLDANQNKQKQRVTQGATNVLNVSASPAEDLTSIMVKIGEAEIKPIAPLGQNDYLNVSVSPDGNKLLFRVSGMASYVTTLDGQILKTFENAEFPLWLNNEEVLYAQIEDDGHNYIASDLFIEALKSDKKVNLTANSKVIGLYPSAAAGKIAFNTPSGDIYLIEAQ